MINYYEQKLIRMSTEYKLLKLFFGITIAYTPIYAKKGYHINYLSVLYDIQLFLLIAKSYFFYYLKFKKILKYFIYID